MKIKVILALSIFLIFLGFMSCKKDLNPFHAGSNLEENSHSFSGENNLSSTRTSSSNLYKDSNSSAPSQAEGETFKLSTSSRKAEQNESQSELRVDILPFRWNLNWEKSSGLVTVRLSGEGFEKVDPFSLRMRGPEGSETGGPVRAEKYPFFLMGKFLKREALAIIPEAEAGRSYQVQVTGKYEDGLEIAEELYDTVTIVGRKQREAELALSLKPKVWNLSWGKSITQKNKDKGRVKAFITGEGFEEIMADSILMRGPSGIIIQPELVRVTPSRFLAEFLKTKAITLIPYPALERYYEIHILGRLKDGTEFDLSSRIFIKGKKS